MSPRQAPRPALVTVAEAARQMSTDDRQVYRYIYDGLLAHVRLPSRGNGNGRIRIEQSELDKFIAGCRQAAQT